MFISDANHTVPFVLSPSANYFTLVFRLVFSLSHPAKALRDPYLIISFRSKSETTESGESVHEEAESTI